MGMGEGSGMDDAKMMDMFKGLLGGTGGEKGDGSDELFGQF